MANERVLVVEDEPAVARGLVIALEEEGFRVDLAEDGRSALELAASRSPQIVLLDIRLPDINGFDVCRKLRQSGHRMPILMLTARDDATDKVLGLELGADDYIVKPYHLKELISRMRAQLRRAYGDLAAPASQEVIRFGEFEIDMDQWELRKGNDAIFLTLTEFRLLRYLITRPNRVCSRDDLIEHVWGYDSDIGSSRIVDVHVSHLREKLEDDPNDPRWIITVRGIGYKFSP
ncbi:MAG: response regulator transcription factor [Anaerolineales bacterium]|jgi:DNA-binding response OmpR family regulator